MLVSHSLASFLQHNCLTSNSHTACHDYSLPLEVAEHIDFVIPTVQPNVKIVKVPIRQDIQPLSKRDNNITSNAANASNSNVLSGCDTRIVPSCLKALYNMTYTPKMAANNSVGVGKYKYSCVTGFVLAN
jgi:tripeptidyl-peptidase-1